MISSQKIEQAYPTPCIEYRVLTKAGRTFSWSATSLNELERDMSSKGHTIVDVQTWTEWESEQEREARDMQREWVFDFNNVIEKEAKPA